MSSGQLKAEDIVVVKSLWGDSTENVTMRLDEFCSCLKCNTLEASDGI